MLWAVPVLPRTYRYCPDHTGTAQNIPVLPKAYRFQKQTGTVHALIVRGGQGGMSWAPNPKKNNTLKKSTNEVEIFEAHYFYYF